MVILFTRVVVWCFGSTTTGESVSSSPVVILVTRVVVWCFGSTSTGESVSSSLVVILVTRVVVWCFGSTTTGESVSFSLHMLSFGVLGQLLQVRVCHCRYTCCRLVFWVNYYR